MTDIRERHEEHCPACQGTDYIGRPCRGRDMVPRGDAIREADRADKAEAALAEATELAAEALMRLGKSMADAKALAEAGQAVLDWDPPERWAGPHDWLKEVIAAHKEATE